MSAGTPTTTHEEGSELEVDHKCDDGCWDDNCSWVLTTFSEDSESEFECPTDVELTDTNPIFDFYGMKARPASQHAVERSYTTLARRRRTTKRGVGRVNSQEPIGGRNDIWRAGLEKGALTTYTRRRCRCDYCMQLDTLAQDRRTLRWAVRRAEQRKDWEGGRSTANKKPRWADYDWNVGYGAGDAGEGWGGAEGVFESERVPPMEVSLLDLVYVRRPQSRRAVQARPSLYSGIASRGTDGSLSATEFDLSIEPSSPNSGSGPLLCDPDWEVLSMYSEWDRCSVQSL